MQFPESWLRSWANPEIDSQALADRLTMAGLEVEELGAFAPPFSGVVVARVASVAEHPNADRLHVCQVDDGTGEPLQIVCGAPNVRAGLTVALARIGAVLPDGQTIAAVRMRSVPSAGMLCSARELGLSSDHAGLIELSAALVPGTDLRQALDLDDARFVLKLTPNRADCLSIRGVAREVAALTGCALQAADAAPVAPTIDDRLPVQVQAPDLCGRFTGRVVRGVNAQAPTPEWMKARLERAGMRPISVLVDISNYAMLELGHPTHVFDLRHVAGGLTVRWGRAGETLTLLDGQTVEVGPDVGVIESGGQLQSLAGVMGGQDSAVSAATTDIFIECAFWWPDAIMGLTRRFKLSSEAAHRFERGVDFAGLTEHLERMTQLVLEICGGQAGPVDDQTLSLPERAPVRMRLSRCARVLGVEVPVDVVADAFTRLGFEHRREGDAFVVTPPAPRFDIAIEEDLIEEVARIHGFDRIPDAPPVAPAVMRPAPETHVALHELRARLVGLDYQEVINFSFVDEAWERDYCGNADPIRLLNPIASQLAVMRSSLIGGLLANVAHNAKHRQNRVRVFEIGRVFARDPSVQAGDWSVRGVAQPNRVAGVAWGAALPEQWAAPARAVDFFDIKGDVQSLLGPLASKLHCTPIEHPALHPGRGAQLLLDGRPVGVLGEVHPRWVQALDLAGQPPVVFELDAAALAMRPFPRPQVLSRQPVVIRDLAIWVPAELPWQSILETLEKTIASESALAVVKDIKLFDVWRDSGASPERSLALRLRFQGADKTLDDAQIDACMQQLTQALAQAHGARLRS